MAAVSDLPLTRIVDLRHLRSGDLDPMLEEETRVWHQTLNWDFRASASLVRRFLDMQALNGYALVANSQPVGYCYYVCEEKKGLIGDLYVMKDFLSVDREQLLLGAVVDTLVKTPNVHRIESQLMMLRSNRTIVLPQRQSLKVYVRIFMEADLGEISLLKERAPAVPVVIEGWTERKQDDAASLIANAYQGHVDAEINDQYRSPAGARKFLTNIIQFPGCGSFFPPASYVAIDPGTRKLSGICLGSLVHTDVGHITQVCVSKSARGTGLGYELIRRSLDAFARHGCRKASLTVTATNRGAIALYERMGFRKSREFVAYVWSEFRPRAAN
jgi:ribosomal protein S18 acetylase RimI-like enzyme